MSKKNIWDPLKILFNMKHSSSEWHYGIVILNTKINFTPEFLLPLWNNASIKFTVDGGTNRWYKWFEENKLNCIGVSCPDFVSGDMDSINPEILDVIRGHSKISVIITSDQNETDFTKSLKEINKICTKTEKKISDIIAVVDTAGRLDQIMANINTLYKALNAYPNVNIYQLSNSSLSWLLNKGKHKIYIPDLLRINQTWCALIPVGEQCDNVSTTGLKWNLDKNTLKFGELVSTSNTYCDQSYVTVENENPLLWSMGLQGLNLSNNGNDNL